MYRDPVEYHQGACVSTLVTSPFSGERPEDPADERTPQLRTDRTGSTAGSRPENIANILPGSTRSRLPGLTGWFRGRALGGGSNDGTGPLFQYLIRGLPVDRLGIGSEERR